MKYIVFRPLGFPNNLTGAGRKLDELDYGLEEQHGRCHVGPKWAHKCSGLSLRHTNKRPVTTMSARNAAYTQYKNTADEVKQLQWPRILECKQPTVVYGLIGLIVLGSSPWECPWRWHPLITAAANGMEVHSYLRVRAESRIDNSIIFFFPWINFFQPITNWYWRWLPWTQADESATRPKRWKRRIISNIHKRKSGESWIRLKKI